MEYPSKNDFYLKFKAIYTEEGMFSNYILVTTSSNIYTATGIMPENILGKKLSQIATENDSLYGLNEFYNTIIPGARRKFEFYSEVNDKWYLINLFSEEKDYILLIYSDISIIKRETSILENRFSNESHFLSSNPYTKMYYRDNLTNLYTRDFFYEELDRLDAIRMLPLTVIMADVNSLKLINDAFGHDMGDKVLKRVASIMKDSFRKHEIISRIGGDEFAAILPMTSEDTAVEIVERVKVELEKNPLDYIVLSVSFGVATKVYKDESAILLPNTKEDTALEIVERIKEECIKNPLDFIKISISFGVATKIDKEEDIDIVMQKADNRMYYMKIKEQKKARCELLDNLRQRLEDTSFETKDHNKRLENLSMLLADNLGLDENNKEELRLLCNYHDIGKVGISEHILSKKKPLNEDEWDDIKRHSEIGYHILKDINNDMSINDLILIHHERWDGNGYPGFLKNGEIPIVIRIFSIADAYDAMVNDRPYKSKISNKDALREIKDNAGSQFDPALAETFVELMENNYVN